MKKSLVLVLMVVCAITVIGAESWWEMPVIDAPDENVFTRYDSALGISGYFMLASVPCLTYQHWISPDLGIAISGGATYDPNYGTPDFETAAFIQLQHGLYTSSSPFIETRLYTWGLAGIDVSNRGFASGIVTNGSFGAGIGLEVTTLAHISFPFEFGYAIQGPETLVITGTGRMGICYRY